VRFVADDEGDGDDGDGLRLLYDRRVFHAR
jgi:hypothetical protein